MSFIGGSWFLRILTARRAGWTVAMTMEFSVADPTLLQGLKKGDLVKFRINPDRVITQIAVK